MGLCRTGPSGEEEAKEALDQFLITGPGVSRLMENKPTYAADVLFEGAGFAHPKGHSHKIARHSCH